MVLLKTKLFLISILQSSRKASLLMRLRFKTSSQFERRLFMTRNQIEYWRNVETKRNNREVERETNRSNVARENETHRANVQKEWLDLQKFKHQKYTDSLDYVLRRQQQQEIVRSNQAQERLKYDSQQETKRSNLASEEIRRADTLNTQARNEETRRSNLAGETLRRLEEAEQRRSNEAREYYNMSSLKETQLRYAAQRELERSELEEKQRSNVANENIKRMQNTLDFTRLSEVERHNRALENLEFHSINARFLSEALKAGVSVYNNSVNSATTLARVNGGVR